MSALGHGDKCEVCTYTEKRKYDEVVNAISCQKMTWHCTRPRPGHAYFPSSFTDEEVHSHFFSKGLTFHFHLLTWILHQC
jgi:hypothetical protein